MATIAPVPLQINNSYDVHTFMYNPMANGDVGAPITEPENADRSVQVEGPLGAGGTAVLQGSLDNVNWETLHDPFGNPISLTSPGIRGVSECVPYMRPAITAGDGTTAVKFIIFTKKVK